MSSSFESSPGASTAGLDPEHRAVVEDEVEMAARVARRIARSVSEQKPVHPKPGVSLDAELIDLRDQIGEARAEDVPALLAEMMRLSAVAGVGPAKRQGLADPKAPYFGHMRLEEDGRRRDVLIGKRAMVDRKAGVVIVDWRNAPVSRLYYRYDEGDEYEEELGEQLREGEVLVRRTVSFNNGDLVRVTAPPGTFLVKDREAGREWVAIARTEGPELKGGAGVAQRAPNKSRVGRLGHDGEDHRPDKHLPEIAALIDREQFDAMTRSDAGVVVLQGGAGSGKTTVALHRIAWLCFEAPERFRPQKTLFVVYQPALVRYVERVLPSLDVPDVQVRAYMDWAQWAVRKILPGKKRKFLAEAPPEVSKLKKHPHMLVAIDAQVARRRAAFEASLEELGNGALSAHWREVDAKLPLIPRLEAFKRHADRAAPDEDTRERARKACNAVLARASDLLEEWEELVTDLELLEGTKRAADPEYGLNDVELERALRWCREQITEPDDDYDPDARRGVDGHGLDHGVALCFDPHDLPLLLNLWIARTGGIYPRGQGKKRRGKKRNKGKGESGPIEYDHIAVDEAQDLSAVELKPLVVAAGERCSVTLAGDIVQKVIFDNGFDEWPTLMKQLGTAAVEVEPFRLTYRSTQEVVELARYVLGDLAPPEEPTAVRSGAPVEGFAFADPGEEVAFLAEQLRSLMGREPRANVAVLCRYPERAAFYAKMLEQAEVPRLRHVDGPDFSFNPGIDVTHISQVKGLEYDYVILAECTRAMYPDEVAARHLLHIAATRAAYQLWITTLQGQASPLIPAEVFQDA